MHRNPSTPPSYRRVDTDTNQYFAKPSQESAQIDLEKGIAAVVFYISPEETGKGWREGAISIAVVKKNLIALSGAIDAMQGEYGAAYKTQIAIITVKDDAQSIANVMKFINSNSASHSEFRPFQQQLQNQSSKHFFTVGDDEKTVHLNFIGNELIVDCPEFKNAHLYHTKKLSILDRWSNFFKIPEIFNYTSTHEIKNKYKNK